MDAIVLVAALVAMVWSCVFVLRGQPLVGCLAFILALACFGHDFASFCVGSLPLTIDRLVLFLLVVLYFFQRGAGQVDPKPLEWPDWVMFAFAGVLILSTIFHSWRPTEVSQTSPFWRLIGGYLIPIALFWIARQSNLNRSNISLLHGALACFGVYLAITAILEISEQWWAVFPRYIADPDVGIHFGRSRGPMTHSVSFGLYLATCLLATWCWRWRFGPRGKLILVGLVPLMIIGLYFTYTRSVWLGAGLGIIIVFGLTLRGIYRPLVLGGMVSAGLLVGVLFADKILGFQRETSAVDTRRSVEMRSSFAYVSWHMFKEKPFLGFGFGQFPSAKLPYLSDRSTALNLGSIRPYVHHSTVLSLLTETGLIGLGLFLAMLVGWCRGAWRLLQSQDLSDWCRAQAILLLGTLGIYSCQILFHELTYTPLDNSIVFLLAGATMGIRPTKRLGLCGSSQC